MKIIKRWGEFVHKHHSLLPGFHVIGPCVWSGAFTIQTLLPGTGRRSRAKRISNVGLKSVLWSCRHLENRSCIYSGCEAVNDSRHQGVNSDIKHMQAEGNKSTVTFTVSFSFSFSCRLEPQSVAVISSQRDLSQVPGLKAFLRSDTINGGWPCACR